MAVPEITEQAFRHVRWKCQGTPDQVGMVRRRLRRKLGPGHPCLESVILCASETCTNAIAHTASGAVNPEGRWFTVDLEWGKDWAKVSVHDTGSIRVPHVVRAADADENGRGLLIVKSEADEWGDGPSPNGLGRVVWFIVRAR